MKNILALLLVLFGALFAYSCSAGGLLSESIAPRPVIPYDWNFEGKFAIITMNAPWPERTGASAVTFNNKIYLISGRYEALNYNGVAGHHGGSNRADVWHSGDGTNWSQIPNAFAATIGRGRGGARSIVIGNSIYTMGGMYAYDIYSGTIPIAGGDKSTNEVFKSDGSTWSSIANDANPPNFSPRSSSTLFEHNGKMWMLGGNMVNTTTWIDEYYNDVWSSSDGINWNPEIANAAFPVRSGGVVVSLSNTLYLMGGQDWTSPTAPIYHDDMWSSTDGVTWQPAGNLPNGARSSFGAAVIEGAIYMFGGSDLSAYPGPAKYYSDIWKWTPADGWKKITDDGFGEPGKAMYSFTYTVLDRKIYILSGTSRTGSGPAVANNKTIGYIY